MQVWPKARGVEEAWGTPCVLARLCLLSGLGLLAAGCDGSQDPGPSLASKVQQARSEPNPATRAQRLIAVAAEQKQVGDARGAENSLATALLAAAEIEQLEDRADALARIATAQAKMDRAGEAKQTVKRVEQTLAQIEDPERKVPPLLKLADTYLKYLESRATAEYYLEQALEAARTIERPAGKREFELKIATIYFAAGNGETAREILDAAVEAIEPIEDARTRADLQVAAFLTAKELEADEQATELRQAAKQSIGAIEDSLNRGYALLNLGRALKRTGAASAKQVLAEAQATAENVGDRNLQEPLLQEIRQAQRR